MSLQNSSWLGDNIASGLSYDSFSRRRFSLPKTLVDIKHLKDKEPLIFDEAIGGSGTSVHDGAASIIMSTTLPNDYVIRQQKWSNPYEPGKSQLIIFTGRFSQQTGVVKRAGYFNSNNVAPYDQNYDGVFFEVTESTVNVVIAKGGVLRKISKEEWNIDKLNGSGNPDNPSSINLDMNRNQIFWMSFSWLGTGSVQFGFFIENVPIVAHRFDHANIENDVYINSPNKPVRCEIRQIGPGVGECAQTCATVISEGSGGAWGFW